MCSRVDPAATPKCAVAQTQLLICRLMQTRDRVDAVIAAIAELAGGETLLLLRKSGQTMDKGDLGI